jgi:hypothetical protein
MSNNVKKANTNERVNLLKEASGTWDCNQVKKYFGWSYGKARKMMITVELKVGVLPCSMVGKRRVRIDDLLELYGTTREKELEILKTGGTNGN